MHGYVFILDINTT